MANLNQQQHSLKTLPSFGTITSQTNPPNGEFCIGDSWPFEALSRLGLSLVVRCYRDRLAWLQGRNDKWRPDRFRICFGFQRDRTTNYVTQFVKTDFFSLDEPFEIA